MRILGSLLMLGVALLVSGCTYPCDPSHCYGTATFDSANVRGALTIVDLAPISDSGKTGFVDNEMWIVERGNAACSDDIQSKMCWVEVGYIAQADPTGAGPPRMFWADSRAHGGFHYHDLGPLDPQWYGSKAILVMIRDSTDASTWRVSAIPVKAGAAYSGLS